MKIKLLCPTCWKQLKDKHGAKECSILAGGHDFLDMECLECEKYYKIEIETTDVTGDYEEAGDDE